MRNYKLKKAYGITIEQYDAMVAAQNGMCPICLGPLAGSVRRAHVDHCHVTGKVRGILCSNCNSGIGKLQESPAIFNRAATYLESHRVVS